MSLLELRNIHTYYGNLHILKGVSLTVEPGEIVTLIGNNGAGKTTTLRAIQGLVRLQSGSIFFQNQLISSQSTATIVRLGIAQSPEGRLIFPKMTVLENLEMGALTRHDRHHIKADFDWVLHLFPRLQERLHQAGGTLSGGEQQMLAMGRALMSRPRLLLLDEPSMGLAPLLVNQLFSIVQAINAGGATILLIEQNAKMALKIADRGYVLQTGQIVLSGTTEELQSDAALRSAYFNEA